MKIVQALALLAQRRLRPGGLFKTTLYVLTL